MISLKSRSQDWIFALSNHAHLQVIMDGQLSLLHILPQSSHVQLTMHEFPLLPGCSTIRLLKLIWDPWTLIKV